MNKLLDGWIFVNFCGQKIGQFGNNYVLDGLLNVLLGEITYFFYIPLFYVYISLGFRAFLPLILLIVIVTIKVRYIFKGLIIRQINIDELEKKYKFAAKRKRILYFILSIIMVVGSFLTFVFSLTFVGYLL